MTESHDNQLTTILRDRQSGAGTCMLVVGDGLNIQAATERGERQPRVWRDIMRRLWRDAGSEPPARLTSLSSPVAWHCLVDAQRRRDGVSWAEAEAAARRALVDRLRKHERNQPEGQPLYGDIANAGLAHILSLNVDACLVRSCGGQLASDPQSHDFMTAYATVAGTETTRVWFPYGSTADPQTLQLGYDEYDRRLMEFESRRAATMEDLFLDPYTMDRPTYVFEDRWQTAESWYDLFFVAPLVFVGTSLPANDWPLWWLLQQRARNVTPLAVEDRPPTFCLTSDETDLPHLRGGPAGIEVVRFPTFDQMWAHLRATLNDPSPSPVPAWRS